MVEVDAGIEHRDLRAAGPRAPGVRRVDVVILRAVAERVLGRIERVVRRLRGREVEVVALGVGDLGPAREPPAQDPQRDPRAWPDERQPAVADRPEALGDPARVAQCRSLAVLRRFPVEPDEQLPAGSGGRRARGRARRQGGDEERDAGGPYDVTAST
jgi:hypothetical protein